ncbi:MAG: rhodanese-like domain-containing protein, partial [Candidatus Heimdallarchaeota archaeon]
RVVIIFLCGLICQQLIIDGSGCDYENLSIKEVKYQLEIDPSIYLLDVRRSSEFFDGYIEGAKNINVNEISYYTEMLPEDNETGIIVYCDNGFRSVTGVEKLMDLGYNNVSNMEDGFNEWKKKGYPYIVGTNTIPTSKTVNWHWFSIGSLIVIAVFVIDLKKKEANYQ